MLADIGNPHWVDACIGYQRHPGHRYTLSPADYAMLATSPSVVLLGYSRGGDVVRWLSTVLDNIVGAVIYEAPCFGDPHGHFPVLWVTNRQSKRTRTPSGRLNRSSRECLSRWSAGREVTVETGGGRHVKRVDRPETFNLGHGWDCSLNESFRNWVASRKMAA